MASRTTKLVVLGYQGTLTTLSEPVAYVNALRNEGWTVVLWSGHWERDIRTEMPGLVERLDRMFPKPGDLTDLLQDSEPLTEFVLVDDDPLMRRLGVRVTRNRSVKCRALAPSQMMSLLSSVEPSEE